jgi:hypothetical protein
VHQLGPGVAGGEARVQVRVLELIRTLHSHNLPLCFLILSRPELWIKQHIESRSFQSITETLDLYQVGDHLKDVEKYIRDELARIAEARGEEPGDNERWPGEDLVESYLWRTRGHMLYATTVIRHIDDPYDDPRQRLRDILNYKFNSTPDFALSTPFSSLHELYRQILQSYPRANRDTMVEVLEEMVVSPHQSTSYRTLPSLNVLDRLAGRVPGRGIKVMRPLHAVIRLSNKHRSDDGEGFFYHSSFREFLEAESPLLPDVTLNFQNGFRRLLMGCFKSLSVIGMDGNVVLEEHVKFSLEFWPIFWHFWKADADPDSSQLLKSFLAVDFAACLSQKILLDRNHLRFHWYFVPRSYHPTDNIITRKVCSPLAEEALLHLRSSVEQAWLRILDPVYLSSVSGHRGLFDRFSDLFQHFALEISEHCPPIFDDVVRALRRLLEEQEEIFEKLERHKPFSLLEEEQSSLKPIFKLARQIEKS